MEVLFLIIVVLFLLLFIAYKTINWIFAGESKYTEEPKGIVEWERTIIYPTGKKKKKKEKGKLN